jgi:hypothetical protein
MPRRISLAAALVASTVLMAGAPAAGAQTSPRQFPAFAGVPGPGMGNVAVPGPCGTSSAGGAGGSNSGVCLGAGLSFIGPSIGQIASVIGPTIISPAFVGNSVVVSAGDAVAGP